MNRIGTQTRVRGFRTLRVLIAGTLLWMPFTLARAQEPQQQEEKQQEPPRPEEHAKPPAQTPPSRQQEPEQRETTKPPSHEERQAPPSRPPEKQAPSASQPERQDHDQVRTPQREEPSDQRNIRIEHAGGSVQKRVPDSEFREHFGREHHFRIAQRVVVAGYPRFQYSGVWFVIVDPWPVVWVDTDNFFIDYIDGAYYLCDVAHPDVLVLVSVA